MKTVNLLFSGGRTSGYLVEMSLRSRVELGLDVEFIITFANTSREHDKTLEFVNACDKRWQDMYGESVVWLEANVHHESRKPSSHTVVCYETAKRDGEVFEEVVRKYGLPNGKFLHCTRELKENPIISYMESLGHKKGHTYEKKFYSATYETWVGIREDEPKRLGGRKDGAQRKRYPLANDPECDLSLAIDKQDVIDFWSEMPFDLGIPEHLGNCIDCHKKSFNKLFKCIADLGEKSFRFTAYLDVMYSMVKAQQANGEIIERKRFRGYTNTKELIAMFRESEFNQRDYDEETGGCSESCNGFDENEPEELTTMTYMDYHGIEEYQI